MSSSLALTLSIWKMNGKCSGRCWWTRTPFKALCRWLLRSMVSSCPTCIVWLPLPWCFQSPLQVFQHIIVNIIQSWQPLSCRLSSCSSWTWHGVPTERLNLMSNFTNHDYQYENKNKNKDFTDKLICKFHWTRVVNIKVYCTRLYILKWYNNFVIKN